MTQYNGLYKFKRVLSVVLALAVLLLALPAMSFTARAAAASEFSGGNGTEDNPYLISTKEDLVQLATDVNNNITYENIFFRMTTDIDLSNDPWAPIGNSSSNDNRRDRNFSGSFDGGGHEITRLNVTGASFAGLFGAIGSKGTVMNLTVSGSVSGGTYYSGGIAAYNNLGTIDNCVNKCSVTSEGTTKGFKYIGGIAGYNCGTISNCRNEGTINGTDHNAGGIAGWSNTNSPDQAAVIENCWNEGEVSINTTSILNYVGGIVGDLQGGSFQGIPDIVKNCYNVADISNTGTGESNVGGIAGRSHSGTIVNCYNIGGLSNNGEGTVGGIVGKLSNGTSTPEVTSCYYLNTAADNGCGEIAEDSIITDLTEVTSDQLKEESTFKGWDFNKTWNMRSSLGRPVLLTLTSELLFEGSGTADDPYVIDTAGTLQAFAQMVNNGSDFEDKFIALADDIDLLEEGVCGADIGSWTPIGKDKAFKGTFDGKGHKILNLYIDDGSEDNAGLFGINNGTIKDLTVTGTVTGGRYAGGIVGTNKLNGKIESCSNACDVTGSSEVGGIAGFNEGGAIDNCYNTGDITGDSKVGGVSGYNDRGTIENSYSIGDINGSTEAGGIAGSNHYGTVENCYYLDSTADVGIGGEEDADKTRAIDAETFASGEIAWLLQNGQDYPQTLVWGQELKNSPNDYPVLTSDINKRVCRVEFTVNGVSLSKEYIYYGGTVAVSDPASVPEGKTFGYWECNNSKFTSSTQVTGDITVTAVFTDNLPDLTDVTVTVEKGKDYINITLVPEIEDTEFYYIDANGTEHKSTNGKFTGLTAGTTYEIYIRCKGADTGTLVATVTTVNSDGSTTLKPGETVKGTKKSEDVTNSGGNVSIKDSSGNETEAALPSADSDVEIDSDGNVIIPGGSKVKHSNSPEMTLPDGGVVGSDGSVTGKVQIGSTVDIVPPAGKPVKPNDENSVVVPDGTVVTPPNGPQIKIGNNNDETIVDADGNITFPNGGNAEIGSSRVNVPSGTLEPQNNGTVYVPEGTKVTGNDGYEATAPEGGAIYDPSTGRLKLSHTVKFNSRGGSAVANERVADGEQASKPDAPTRTGYKFGGWYTDEDCTEEYDFTKPVTSDIELFAKWIEVNDDPTDGNDSGNVNIDSSSGANAPSVSMDKETSDKLKAEIIANLNEREKAALENGDDLNVILKVDNADNTVSAEDKQAVSKAISNSSYTVGQYVNIDLIKLINEEVAEKITELNSPIRVTVEIPQNIRSSGRTYAVVRVHNGVSEILEDMDNDPNTITILTDKFSTYTIVYKNALVDDDDDVDDDIISSKPNNSGTDSSGTKNPYTGNGIPGVAAMVLACATGTAAVAIKKRKTK